MEKTQLFSTRELIEIVRIKFAFKPRKLFIDRCCEVTCVGVLLEWDHQELAPKRMDDL